MINQKPKDQFIDHDQFDDVDIEDDLDLDQSDLENLAIFNQEQSNQVPNVLDNSFVNQSATSEPIDQPEVAKPTKTKRARKILVSPIAYFDRQGSNQRLHIVID